MSQVIEFPSRRVMPDSLPQPGDSYQAYDVWQEMRPTMLTFVFADRSMTSRPYHRLESSQFSILNDEGNRDGDGAIHLEFGSLDGFYDIVITGYNIWELCYRIGDVRWIWERPTKWAAVKDDEPVVHSIEIRKKEISRLGFFA